jgi:transmembrane protein TMEM174 (potassium channel)
MAVSITLLVLDLKLPPGVTDAELPKALAESMHGLWCYVLSFLVIGILWMAHHHQFSYIERIDGVLIWLNLFFLIAVGLIPFVTSVMSDHGIALPTMLYAGALFFDLPLAGGDLGPRLLTTPVDEARFAEGRAARRHVDAAADRSGIRALHSRRLCLGIVGRAMDVAAGDTRRPRRPAAQISARLPRCA